MGTGHQTHTQIHENLDLKTDPAQTAESVKIIRETLNLLMCADSSTKTKTDRNGQNKSKT